VVNEDWKEYSPDPDDLPRRKLEYHGYEDPRSMHLAPGEFAAWDEARPEQRHIKKARNQAAHRASQAARERERRGENAYAYHLPLPTEPAFKSRQYKEDERALNALADEWIADLHT